MKAMAPLHWRVVRASPARPDPTERNMPTRSLDRGRGHRTAYGVCQRKGCRTQQEVVLAVGAAISRELVEGPELTLRQPHVAQVDHVYGQQRGRVFTRPHFEHQGVGRDGSDVVITQPLDGLRRETRARVAEPRAVADAQPMHLASPHAHDVAWLDRNARHLRRAIEIVTRDWIALFEVVDALERRDVEQ